MGLCVFSLPISLMMIMRICVLYLIIIKSEAWPIYHCLGLGHETMVCTVCISVFLCLFCLQVLLHFVMNSKNKCMFHMAYHTCYICSVFFLLMDLSYRLPRGSFWECAQPMRDDVAIQHHHSLAGHIHKTIPASRCLHPALFAYFPSTYIIASLTENKLYVQFPLCKRQCGWSSAGLYQMSDVKALLFCYNQCYLLRENVFTEDRFDICGDTQLSDFSNTLTYLEPIWTSFYTMYTLQRNIPFEISFCNKVIIIMNIWF